MNKRNWALNQIAFQEKIQAIGVNLVNCGSCGDVIFCNTNDEEITCVCGFSSEPCDFPDFWYRGVENSYEDTEIILEATETNDNDVETNKRDLVLKAVMEYCGGLSMLKAKMHDDMDTLLVNLEDLLSEYNITEGEIEDIIKDLLK